MADPSVVASGWLTPKSPVDLKKATVCITGASEGIGLALAKQFVTLGSTVIVTGRRAEALQKAKEAVPELHTFQGDAATLEGRETLVAWLLEKHPKLNVFLNNAGLMRQITAAKETDDWSVRQAEIALNLEAPIHFTHLLKEHFLKLPEGSFIYITSGLAFTPYANAPVYGATKAGLHSWVMAERWAYLKTNVRLVELAPPLVKTQMTGGNLGEDADEFAASVVKRFAAGELEAGFKDSETRRLLPRDALDKYCYGLGEKMNPPQIAI